MVDVTLLAFAVVAFIGIATPGPTVLLALTNGSRFGVRRAMSGMAGAVLSDFVLIGAVALGLGALLAASEFWFGVVKWVGVCYLVTWNQSKPHFVQLLSQEQEFVLWLAGRRTSSF